VTLTHEFRSSTISARGKASNYSCPARKATKHDSPPSSHEPMNMTVKFRAAAPVLSHACFFLCSELDGESSSSPIPLGLLHRGTESCIEYKTICRPCRICEPARLRRAY